MVVFFDVVVSIYKFFEVLRFILMIKVFSLVIVFNLLFFEKGSDYVIDIEINCFVLVCMYYVVKGLLV